jgi:transcriptional regulator with XRE-family HTH domain
MDFGTLLRRQREAQGVSQQALALRAGTSQAAISDIERGRVSPSLETAERLLLCLGQRLVIEAQTLPMDASLESLIETQRLSPQDRLARMSGMADFMLRGRAAVRLELAAGGTEERP